LGFVCGRLASEHPEKLFTLNFFTEYHGKSVVDGHFGVLSRWLGDGEKVRFIKTIHDLVSFYREKAGSEGCGFDVDFEIYSRPGRPSFFNRMVVKDFRCYLSFVRTGDKLYASTLSTLKPEDYMEVDFKIKIQKDNRSTKYAPETIRTETEIPVVMGSRSQQVLVMRMRLTDGLPDLMELTEYSPDADAMEVDEV